VRSRREGRSVIYAAGYGHMSDLLAYLMEDCCGGDAAICAPLAVIAERCACAVTEPV
jgi:ArsR family transcriptional regulator